MEQNITITVEELSTLINKFDLGYEMSEEHDIFLKGTLEKKLIKEHIFNLNIKSENELPALNLTGKTNFRRYFS